MFAHLSVNYPSTRSLSLLSPSLSLSFFLSLSLFFFLSCVTPLLLILNHVLVERKTLLSKYSCIDAKTEKWALCLFIFRESVHLNVSPQVLWTTLLEVKRCRQMPCLQKSKQAFWWPFSSYFSSGIHFPHQYSVPPPQFHLLLSTPRFIFIVWGYDSHLIIHI